jgi:hypothetical protein
MQHAYLSKGRILPILAFAVIPFCILCLLISISDMRRFPGEDLPPKVAGARLLAAGLDPYDYSASPPNNEYFRTNNSISFTPGLLLLYVPLSGLSYPTQRTIYFCLDWVFALLVFYLLQRYFCRNRMEKYLCWIIYAAFVICSYTFRLHVERGQYYIFILLLLCVTAASIKNNRADWLLCIPSALSIIIRPTYGLMLVAALIALREYKWVIRVTLVAAILFIATLHFGGVKRWIGFAQVVRQVNLEMLDQVSNGCGDYSRIPTWSNLWVHVIEGENFHKGLNPHWTNGTLIGISDVPYWRPCGAHGLAWISGLNSVCMALVLAGGIAVAFIARSRMVSANILIAFIMLWPIIFEMFSPERYLYTGVLEVLPLVLVIVDEDNFKSKIKGTARFYALASMIALGVLAPVIYQIVHNVRLASSVVGILILVALPICLAIYCVYGIVVSDKRVQEYPTN